MIFTNSYINLGLLSLLLLGASGCIEKKGGKELVQNRKSMALEELEKKRLAAAEMKNYEVEASILQQMVIQHTDNQNSKTWRMELGKLYSDMNEYPLAYRIYRDYTKLYPSDINTESVAFMALDAKYKQTIEMRQECDSSATLKTIKLCKEYLKQPFFKTHEGSVQDILKTCENRLVNKDIYVFNTYLAQGKLPSAKSRLDVMKEKYKDASDDVKSQCLFLEFKLAKAENNTDSARIIYDNLQSLYPESTAVKMASSQIKYRA
ncbi:outer membrane protein assembly factor BamD [Candidatus Dependentiae bacterium]|nr:outer membrane protein assembly factor BamD [Candidatus Dependentiae bacterium]